MKRAAPLILEHFPRSAFGPITAMWIEEAYRMHGLRSPRASGAHQRYRPVTTSKEEGIFLMIFVLALVIFFIWFLQSPHEARWP